MNIDLGQATVKLDKNQSLRLHDAAGTIIVVVWGTVRVTQHGDPRDYVLGAGESLTLNASGITLACAMQDAAFSILEVSADASAAGTTVDPQFRTLMALDTMARHRCLHSLEMQSLQREARRRRDEHVYAVMATAWHMVKRAFLWLREQDSRRYRGRLTTL